MRSLGPRHKRSIRRTASVPVCLIGVLAFGGSSSWAVGVSPPGPGLPDDVVGGYQATTQQGRTRLTLYRNRLLAGAIHNKHALLTLTACQFSHLERRMRDAVAAPNKSVFSPDRRFHVLRVRVRRQTWVLTGWDKRDPYGRDLPVASCRQRAIFRSFDSLVNDLVRTGRVTGLGC